MFSAAALRNCFAIKFPGDINLGGGRGTTGCEGPMKGRTGMLDRLKK